MPREYTTSAISTEVMWNLLQQRGISESEIAENTGIDPSVLHSPNKCIPLGQYLRLWELTISITGDPALGLHLSRYYNSGQSHFVTSIILSSATLLDGLQQWIRYASLICNADRFELQEHGDFVTLVYTNISQTHKNRWLPELYFSLMYGLLFQERTHGEHVIEEIWMAHPVPDYADEYQAVFSTKVLFDQSEYHVRLKRESLDVELKTLDPYYQSILKKYSDDSMRSRGQSAAFSEKTRLSIIEQLPRNRAYIQTIADSFHMDRRTLLRRLKSEGTTFKELLEDTRKNLAHDYLIQGLSITQISYLLGFTAASSFQVAFKRWYGQSPGDYRRDNLS